eukprot:scaffold73319_cov72-Phaeocystis_antarctica.AAC.6
MHTSYCSLPFSLALLVGARWAAVRYERARASPRTPPPTSRRAAREAGLQGRHVTASSLSRRHSLGLE